MKTSIIRYFTFILVLLALTACGGGGSSSVLPEECLEVKSCSIGEVWSDVPNCQCIKK